MRPDEIYVAGKGADTARALLDAAAKLGLDAHVVRVSEGGFIAPVIVYDYISRPPRPRVSRVKAAGDQQPEAPPEESPEAPGEPPDDPATTTATPED